jgi:DNA relaxase NicK
MLKNIYFFRQYSVLYRRVYGLAERKQNRRSEGVAYSIQLYNLISNPSTTIYVLLLTNNSTIKIKMQSIACATAWTGAEVSRWFRLPDIKTFDI